MQNITANPRKSSPPKTQPASGGPAFTLIELVVVIGTIGLLTATLLPALAGTKFRTRAAMCVANCRQWGIAMTAYSSDHNNCFPDETVSASSADDVWDTSYQYVTDMAHYGMNNPKLWFCPVRAWTYPAANAWCVKTLGHPLENITNDVARCFAYANTWPPSFMQWAYSASSGSSAGYAPWIKRPWNNGGGPNGGPSYFPSIYRNGIPSEGLSRKAICRYKGNNIDPDYEWLMKSSDPHAAHVPILTDIVIAPFNNLSVLTSLGINAVLPGQGHPAGFSQKGKIQSLNLVYGDGHVETHQRNEIKWRYISSVGNTAFY